MSITLIDTISGFSGFSGLGFSGPSGDSGISGFSGFSGTSGTSGTSGASGTSGESGASGISGFSGFSGTSGTSGTSGESGASGTSGFSGFSGISGTSGGSGASGTSGTSGTSGESGASGISGFSGFSGVSGQTGSTGGEGSPGTSGFSGFSGGGGLTEIEAPISVTFSSTSAAHPDEAKVGKLDVLSFPPDADSAVDFSFKLPPNMSVSDDVVIFVKYHMSSADSGTVRMDLEYEIVDDGGDTTPAAATGTISETIDPSNSAEIQESASFTINSSEISATSETIRFTILRDTGHGSDTHTGSFRIESISVRYIGEGGGLGGASGASGFSGASGAQFSGFSGVSGQAGTAFQGFYLRAYTELPDTSGNTFFNVYQGGGSGNLYEEGMGVAASLATNGTWYLRFLMPPTLPGGTATLRLFAMSTATSGSARVVPSWASVAIGEDPSNVSLNSEGTTSVTWAGGEANVFKSADITLDADTLVAGEILVLNLLFSASTWTLTAESTWQAFIVWV